MATKQFYATGDFRYGTRRLRAGDPIELDASSARLFTALGKITDRGPQNQARESAGLQPIPKAAPKRVRRKKSPAKK